MVIVLGISERLFSSIQSLSCVWLFATPWTAACQASLSITNSQSLLKFTSIALVMPSNHLIPCHPLLLQPSIFPASGSFQMSQFFASGGQITGVSASTSVLPMNIQDWFPLGLTGQISLQSKGLSKVFSSTTVQKHQLFLTIKYKSEDILGESVTLFWILIMVMAMGLCAFVTSHRTMQHKDWSLLFINLKWIWKD